MRMLTYRLSQLLDGTRVFLLYDDPRPVAGIEQVGILPEHEITGIQGPYVMLLAADDWDVPRCIEEAEQRGVIQRIA
jgi:hypothetical protein